jgi:hypothetical protein
VLWAADNSGLSMHGSQTGSFNLRVQFANCLVVVCIAIDDHFNSIESDVDFQRELCCGRRSPAVSMQSS